MAAIHQYTSDSCYRVSIEGIQARPLHHSDKDGKRRCHVISPCKCVCGCVSHIMVKGSYTGTFAMT